MKEIGGYFSLELPDFGSFPNEDGILLNSGRSALEFICNSLEDIKCLWLPYFTCNSVLQPLENAGIDYKFYHINHCFEISEDISLDSGEYILTTNYYGLKDYYIQSLVTLYGKHLIVDNAQAYYATRIPNIPTIYSPRKFVGIPDGGIACGVNKNAEFANGHTVSYNRCSHLLKRIDLGAGEGYSDFKQNDYELGGAGMKSMSRLTYRLLRGIDHSSVTVRRKLNFMTLHNALAGTNQIQLDLSAPVACPLIYPYYIPHGKRLRKKLIDNQIFCATYWPNVFDWCDPSYTEWQLAENVVCLPVDQRYGNDEMEYMIKTIKKYGL